MRRIAFLGLKTLEYRRLEFDLIMCFKIIHQLVDLNENDYFKIPTKLAQNMRQNHSLKKSAIGRNAQTETRSSFFSERILKIWNEIPKEIAEATNINLKVD